MRAHESTHGHEELAKRKPAVLRPAEPHGPSLLITPANVLALQRSAGNAAVAAELTIQRKKMQEIEAGTINGIITLDGKDHQGSSLNITDGWIS